MGQVITKEPSMSRTCIIMVARYELASDLIALEVMMLGVITRMNWLTIFRAPIDCYTHA